MKDLFRGYYKLTDKEIQSIWDNGFISFDTNVLFNIYRYSEDTRKELLKVIKKFSSQLWLTNHSAFEFHKNRYSVISDQIVIYDETIKTFNKLESDIVKNLKTPHLSKTILQKFEKTIKETKKDLEKKKEFYKKLLTNDSIMSSISTTFKKKVGEAFSEEEITKIEKEGEVRYKKKIPPGFKDNDKSENKYGDLIIWKELLKKAKVEKKPFILIIDDLKEDWWLRVQGQTITPRQELSQELYKETQQIFHLYTPDRFLEFASKTEKVKQEVIDEVREIRVDNSTPWFNSADLSKQLYSTYSMADISQSLQATNTLSELIKNNEFMKNLDTFKSIGDLSKTWASNNLYSDNLKNNEFYSSLGNINSMADIQNTYKAISGLTSINPVVETYLKAKKDEYEKQESTKQGDKKEDSK